MPSEIDFDTAQVYAIPMRARFRGITVREGMLIEGPAGWGEFCPFADYDDVESASWLATTIEQCALGWPEPVRNRIPINCTVPAVGPERAHEITAKSGCRTAKVKVADHPESLAEDLARVEAVRDALGPNGAIRVEANGVWTSTPPWPTSANSTRQRAGWSTPSSPAEPSRNWPPSAAKWTCASLPTSPSAAPRTSCGWPWRARPTWR